jgi:FkbH-like protein
VQHLGTGFVSRDTQLHWLPPVGDWRSRLKAIRESSDRATAWHDAVALANTNLDFVQTNAIDAVVQDLFRPCPPPELVQQTVRLAILGSSTCAHLHSGVRLAGLRRGMWIVTYEAGYGQYLQELFDPHSALHQFRPDVVLFALDPYHLTRGASLDTSQPSDTFADVQARLEGCWKAAKATFGCRIIQQAILPVLLPVLGDNEARLPEAPARIIERLNAWLRDDAVPRGIDLLALDARAALSGTRDWHDVALWHRAKQETSPKKSPIYGELVGRILAAQCGRSFKCLVLDLDDTLWGGSIGDDGLDGIVLGQGSPRGEAYVAIQEYALSLASRGVILAVCSKNDPSNALAAFDDHPEMVLDRKHISSFIANWDDKPSNIRRIARELNIGLDGIVLLDDSAFERELVRRELPMVAVPEVSDDPSWYPSVLADAGYFDALIVTREDTQRIHQYRTNLERERQRHQSAGLDEYLRDLDMTLLWQPFEQVDLARIAQLVNKSNQFNLRPQRYSEAQLTKLMDDPLALTLQLRLVDRFGDNGIIAAVIGLIEEEDLFIDTWLMSCRVFGRTVEHATLNLIVECSRARQLSHLIGQYRPTPRNHIVKNHYQKLGFVLDKVDKEGASRHVLALSGFVAPHTPVAIERAC